MPPISKHVYFQRITHVLAKPTLFDLNIYEYNQELH